MKIQPAESGGSQHLILRADSTFTALTLTRWRPGQSGVCLGPPGHQRHGTRSVKYVTYLSDIDIYKAPVKDQTETPNEDDPYQDVSIMIFYYDPDVDIEVRVIFDNMQAVGSKERVFGQCICIVIRG